MIVSFVQTKGGTAKSTLAQCLAFSPSLGRAAKSIALVELDEQGTLKRWWQERESAQRDAGKVAFFQLLQKDATALGAAMVEIIESFELLILDVPGESVSRFHTNFACSLSDLVIIPMRTSTNDEDAFEANMLPIIARILERDSTKRDAFWVLPTFTHPRARKDKVVAYFRDILPEPVGCLDAVFPSRSVYENCNRSGHHLFEYVRTVKGNRRESSQALQASTDVARVAAEIQMRLGLVAKDGGGSMGV